MSRLLGIFGIGTTVIVLAQIAVQTTPEQPLVILAGLLGAFAILRYPFAGLFLSIMLVQLSALVDRFAGNEWALEGLVLLTFAGTILQIHTIPGKLQPLFRSKVFQMGALFLFVAGISALFADYPEEAAPSLFMLTSLLALMCLILIHARTPELARYLLLAVIISTFISASFAVIGHIFGHVPFGLDTSGVRGQSGTSTAGTTTSSIMMLIGTASAAMLALLSPKWRLFFSISAVTGCSGIIFTFSRTASALVAFACGWLAIKFRKARHFPAVLIIGVMLGISMLPMVPDRLWDRFASIGNPGTDWTLGRRLGYHMIGVELLMDNPLLGVGPGNFNPHYKEFEFRWVEGRALMTRALHNMYLSVATETGLLGLAFFLFMIVAALAGLNHARKHAPDPELRQLAEAIQLGYVLWLIAAITQPASTNKYTWILTGLAGAVALIAHQCADPRVQATASSGTGAENTLDNTGKTPDLRKNLGYL